MTLVDTVQVTSIMLGLAVGQRTLEHLASPKDRLLFLPRLIPCVMLISGWHIDWAVWALFAYGIVLLHRFDGPYNGGSDKMTMLIVTCLSAYHLAPSERWQEMAMAYLAVQLVLSYFVSGYIKIIKADWRRGEALQDVFRFSAYPVSDRLRGWADHPRLLWLMSWCVMGFEVLFPLALLHPWLLTLGLLIAATFHLANACLFGLNRFFWIWLCAYPSLIWFQDRVIG
ncbi:HTTM domain-containing protein [uncultured Pelagimonas sp.]|uniref:HTTM domain-containing protein n=1 Tax=uncultured Pelagimonas sp. TaxID=1618102 RepID=UPI002632DD15|nr:HTTM domain-containing protein [uncultured Pelagimonas sp.]